MQAFLDNFYLTLSPEIHATLLADGAGWHISLDLRVPGNMTLVPPLPPAPELNPVDRVWLYLREHFLSHRLHADHAAILDAACHACNRIIPERLRSINSYTWLPQVGS